MSQTAVLILMIGVGGMAGTWARFRLAGAVYAIAGHAFPWGTLVVNVLGSFALGVILPMVELNAVLTPLRAFLTVGVLGAFTTFSSFAYEAAMLVAARQRSRAAAYVAASLGLGLLSLVAGLLLGRAII